MDKNARSGLLRVFNRELRWIFREPLFAIIIIIFPSLIFFLFTALFNRGVIRDIPVAVLDRDNSVMSREVTRKINSIPSVKISVEIDSLNEGKVLLQRGEIYSLIYIQKGFESKVERGIPCEIINFYNNENLLTGGTIVRDITSMAGNISGEIFKDNLLKKGMGQSQVSVMSEPVKVSTRVLFNPYSNYMYYLVSGLLPTALHFFILFSSMYSIGMEIKKGTIGEAMEAGGMKPVVVITGKLLPYTIIYSVTGMFMLVLMFRYLQFPLQGNIYMIMASTVMLVLTYQATGLFFIGLTGNLMKGMLVSSFYASSAFTFSGITFPVIAMYGPARIWSHFLPLSYYLNILVGQAFRGAPLKISAGSFFYMTLFLLLPLLIYPRINVLFSNGNG